MNLPDDELLALHQLGVDYGRDWRLWRPPPSPDGRSGWYATRRRHSPRDTDRGLWPTLAADTAEDLRRELEAQARAAEAPLPADDSIPRELMP